MKSNTETQFPKRPAWLVGAATLILFWLCDSHDWFLFRQCASDTEGLNRIGAIFVFRYVIMNFIGPVALAAILFGPKNIMAAFGLSASFLNGLLLALVFTAVMLAAIAATATYAFPADPADGILRGAFIAGFFEEFFYRAFLFGFLFRFARWGYLPAALASAVVFGAGHLYQSHNLMEAAAIFAITGVGAMWFSWLYVEWRYNIWVPAFCHILMNLWWTLFAVSDTAIGAPVANYSRLVVIAVSIVITVMAARRHGERIIKGRAWFWGGPSTNG